MKKIKQNINQFGLVAAALALAFGHSASDFINSLVGDAIMPLLGYVLEIDDWQNHNLEFGPYSLKWGEIAKDAIRLFVMSAFVFGFLQWLRSEEESEN